MEYQQALMRLKKGNLTHPFYLLSGPEDYLKEEFLQELLNFLELTKGKRFFLERLEGQQVKLPELISEIKQLSLLPGGRLFWIYDPPYFTAPSRKEKHPQEKKDESPDNSRNSRKENEFPGEKELLAFLQEKNGDNILIFSVNEVDRRKKLVRAAEERGMHIQCLPLKGALLKRWIREKFLQEGKEVEEEALDELVGRLGENLYLQKREIEKIVAYLGEEKIVTPEVVQHLVPESSQGNIFNLIRFVGLKDLKMAFYQLDKLYRQNEHPLVILTMLARQFRLLYQYLALQERGAGQQEIAAFLNVQPFVLKELSSQVEKYDREAIASIIARLKKIDLEIKTGRVEGKDALEQLILKLTSSHIHG